MKPTITVNIHQLPKQKCPFLSLFYNFYHARSYPWSNYGAEARIIRSGFQQRRRATSMKLKSRGESEHIRAILLPVDLT